MNDTCDMEIVTNRTVLAHHTYVIGKNYISTQNKFAAL